MKEVTSVEQGINGPVMKGIRKGPLLAALLVGAFVSILNETLLNVAFPDLMREFAVPATTVQWLATVYMLLIGILGPVSALLQGWFTTRQMYLSGLGLFLAGSIVCGLAPEFGVLLGGRVIQAAGAGLLFPVVMNTILIIFPPEKRGAAMGLIGLCMMLGPAAGPALAGLISDSMSWRSLFLFIVPLAAATLLFSMIVVKNVNELTRPKVDIASIVLSTIAFGSLIYGFSKAGELSWTAPSVTGTLFVGGLTLIAFLARQLRLNVPMLELRTFRYPVFTIAAVILLIVMTTLYATLITLPMFMQGALLMTAVVAGLAMMPGGFANGIVGAVSGVLFDKFGPRFVIVPGMLLMLTSLWLFTRLDSSAGVGHIIGLHVLLLAGVAMTWMPTETSGLNRLPRELYTHGTAILNTLQQVSGAIGTAVFVSLLSGGRKRYLAESTNPDAPSEQISGIIAGMHAAYWFVICLVAIALFLGVFLKRPKEAEAEPLREAA